MTLMITVNILLVLNVSAFFTTIAEAVILILAVLGSSIGKQSAAHRMRASRGAVVQGGANRNTRDATTVMRGASRSKWTISVRSRTRS